MEPDSAAAWYGLGRSLEAGDRTDDAATTLRTARTHGWSMQLDLALGRLELSRGNVDEAHRLLWPIAQAPHGGPARDEATRLLDEVGLDGAPRPGR